MNKVQKIGRDLMEMVVRGNRDQRVYICEQQFAAFAMYYFSEFFTYDIPDFQWRMYAALDRFTRGAFTYLLWVMFRESAKTTLAKIYVVYCICYRKKRFINWDAFDKGNAEQALFDISSWLQTNRLIIGDFGQLYFEDPKKASRESRMKRMGEFITVNGVKVKAYSTQESTRGRIYGKFRPDLYVLEDFETSKTAESVAVTAKVIKHMDELKSGLSVDGQVIFLCNLITETGSVGSLLQEAKENPAAWHVQNVAVEENGEISWPGKYVRTNDEAAVINAMIPNRKEYVVSLEQKRKDLNSGGRKVYEAEMLNSPEASGELFFDRARIDRDIIEARKHPPIKEVGSFRIYEEYKAKYRYAGGADTSKGVMRDACTSIFGRFSMLDREASKIVGAYDSNTTAPDDFGDEMASQGRMFGECLLAPELNNTGFATVTRLKAIYPVSRIYRQVKEDQIGKNTTKDLGWEANSQNVSAIYYAFRTGYDEGSIEIWDIKLLNEMRMFTKRDLESASRRAEQASVEGGVTRHFDLLRAACIWWEMRHHAIVAPVKKSSSQEFVPRSEYQGG